MTWNPLAIPALLGGVLALLLAALVLRTVREAGVRSRLAILLVLESLAVLSSGMGLNLLVDAAGAVRMLAQLHFAVDWLLLGLYLPFVARALETPLLRAFRRPAVEGALLALALAGAISVFALPEWFVARVVASGDRRLSAFVVLPGAGWSVVAIALAVMFTIALFGALSATRHARTDLARQRARAFVVAFGIRDTIWGVIYLAGAITALALSATAILILLQAYVISLIVYLLITAYGILTAHLFDIDVKVKWTIRHGTVAAAFVAAYFFVSEAVTSLLSTALGNMLGLIAAALLIFVLAPLQRFGDQLANAALPGVAGTSEYEAYRKLQIFSAALEGAYRDGEVTARERSMLEELGRALQVRPEDAHRLEEQIRAGRAANGPAAAS